MAAQKVGLVGLGLLGMAIAERLRQAGFEVIGFDIDPKRRELLAERGGRPASSAGEVARGADRVILSLPDSEVVASVLKELAPELREHQKVVDTTTGDPERSAAIGAELLQKGVHYLDATVSGSSDQVRKGEAIVMVGGEPGAGESCADLFATFARAWWQVGSWGSGARMKLVVNLVLGLNRAALAEGLAFARALGLNLEDTLRILRAGASYSLVMDTKGTKMIEGDFTPQARLAQHRKDVRLILAEAERGGAKVPLSEIHLHLLDQLVAAGWGEQDNSAVIKAYD